tara:strand:+ start:814 stop:1086 length:273 start_codon:yes stop_codon:yes gene_type:complete
MAKFITIPTTVAGSPKIIFNTDNVTAVSYLTPTTFAVYTNKSIFTFTTSAAGAASTVTLVNSAITNIAGPTLINVTLATGVTIGALPVVS